MPHVSLSLSLSSHLPPLCSYFSLGAQLEEYAAAHPGTEWASPRATLLLIDRKEDVVAPLLHEYTYQAAVTDALGVRNGVVRCSQCGEGVMV